MASALHGSRGKKRGRSQPQISKVATSMITLTCPHDKQFFVHKNLLTEQSGRFQDMLADDDDLVDINLEDVPSEIVAAFIDWLYTGELPTADSKYEPDSDESEESSEDEDEEEEGQMDIVIDKDEINGLRREFDKLYKAGNVKIEAKNAYKEEREDEYSESENGGYEEEEVDYDDEDEEGEDYDEEEEQEEEEDGDDYDEPEDAKGDTSRVGRPSHSSSSSRTLSLRPDNSNNQVGPSVATCPLPWENKLLTESAERSEMLLETYVFATTYDIPALQRDATDALYAHIDDGPPLIYQWTIMNIYPRLPEDSPIRRFLVDVECAYGYRKDIPTSSPAAVSEKSGAKDGKLPDYDSQQHLQEFGVCSNLPHDYVVAVMLRQAFVMQQMWKGRVGIHYQLDLCNYHVHTEREERFGCGNGSYKMARRD